MAPLMPEPIFRSADAADLQAIEVWLRDEEERVDEGFYCNWHIVSQALKDHRLFVVDASGDPVAFLANGLNQHLIAEVKPDCRGKGYGRVIADAMIAQSTSWGLSVMEIDCAPETSVPFWTRMGFTPVPSRRGYGGGIYAYREIQRRFPLGRGRRVPFAIRFYEEAAHHRGGTPFQVYQGDGESRPGGRVRIPERAVCYAPTVTDLADCYVEIEVGGRQLFRDKTKRDQAESFGVRLDPGNIPFIDAIHSAS